MEFCADGRSLLANGAQAQSAGEVSRRAEQRGGVKADPVVFYREIQAVAARFERDRDGGGAGMAGDIGKRLLGGAIEEDFSLERRLGKSRGDRKGGLGALGQTAQIPELADGFRRVRRCHSGG